MAGLERGARRAVVARQFRCQLRACAAWAFAHRTAPATPAPQNRFEKAPPINSDAARLRQNHKSDAGASRRARDHRAQLIGTVWKTALALLAALQVQRGAGLIHHDAIGSDLAQRRFALAGS